MSASAWVSCQDDEVEAPRVPFDTKVIAHQGAWLRTGLPANSIASLKAAISQNLYGSDCNVQMSSDSVAFVSAGDSLYFDLGENNRLGMLMEEAPYDSLAKITLANAEPLPLLNDYLLAAKGQTATRLVLRLKATTGNKSKSLYLASQAVAAVAGAGVAAMTDYVSADYDVCLLIRQLSPDARVSYTSANRTLEELKAAGITEISYIPEDYVDNIEIIQQAEAAGISTNIWTVNSQNLMNYLLGKKIKVITTDEPELLTRLIKNEKIEQ